MFLKLKNYILIFALIYNNLNVEFAQQILMFLFELKLYKNYFDLKNAEIFLTHENKNHVINLKFNKNLLYDLLYAFSKKEL